jgi:Uncharacterized conserved protein (DUF2183)
MTGTAGVCRAIALLLLLASPPLAGPGTVAAQYDRRSDISSDETVVFFPGVAVETGPSSFDAHIRGWIFEPLKGRAAVESVAATVRALIGLDSGVLPLDQLRNRGALLFVDTERNQKVPIDIAGQRVTLAASEPGGHFQDRVALQGVRHAAGEWLTYRALTKPGDDREFEGVVQLVGRTGVSVVSDIDDTIKDSNVLDKRELALNTFVRDFRGVPGMSDLYQGWARTGGVVFHYVSGSPWQLLAPIAGFMERDSFPRGSFHLRRFRVNDSSAREFLENRTLEFKVETIDRLMALLPDRRFVFVGDSGEKDPEVYAQLAARCPRQVAAILIRNVTQEDRSAPRFVRLFGALAPDIERRVFVAPGELADLTLTPVLPPHLQAEPRCVAR